MLKLEFDNLPMTIIPPRYDAYPADTLVDTKPSSISLFLSRRDERLLFKACEALKEYDMDSALRLAREALAISPDLYDASLLIGIVYAAQEDLEKALSHLESARQALGNCGAFIRRFLPTLRAVVRVSRFHFFPVYPDYYGASLIALAILVRLGNLQKARQIYDELTQKFGARDELRAILAEGYLASQDYASALQILIREKDKSVDDLDTTLNLLKGLAQLGLNLNREAVKSFSAEIDAGETKNEYLCGIARFLYCLLLEEEGCEVLALQESLKINKTTILNPKLREFLPWWQAKLKEKISRMNLDELHRSSYFKWTKDEVEAPVDEKKLADRIRQVMPEYWRARMEEADAEVVPERAVTGIDALFKKFAESAGKVEQSVRAKLTPAGVARVQGMQGAREKADESQPVAEFDLSQTYRWSISKEGGKEFIQLDFKGTRAPLSTKLSGERFISLFLEYGSIILFGILVVMVIRKCA